MSAAPFVPKRDAHCVAISPAGDLVAIGFSGPSNSEFPPRPHPSPRKSAVVILFEADSGKRLRRMETFGDLTRVAFSPDGTLVAASRLYVADEGLELNEVRVWDAATGQVRYRFDRCHAFSFAPNGKELVVVSKKRCVVYELATGTKVRQVAPLAAALTVVHAADGEQLVGIVQADAGFRLQLCSASSGELLHASPPLADPFYSLAWSPAHQLIATGHRQGMVLLHDASTLQPRARLQTGGSGRASPFFSPTGNLLAAADQANSDVVIWETATGSEVARYTFQQGSIRTYGSKSPLRLVRPEEDPVRFVFSPDGEAFLGGPYGGILRLVTTGRDIARYGE